MKKLPHHILFLAFLIAIPFFYCKKEVIYSESLKHEHLPALFIRSSSSSINLLQANEKLIAVRFDWGFLNGSTSDVIHYVIQFSLEQDHFDAPVEIDAGNSTAVGFSVGEFNTIINQLIEPGDSDEISIRVKYMRQVAFDNPKGLNGEEVYYSDMMLIKVATYHHIVEYKAPDYMSLPGNYQSWDPYLAPKIVSKPGEREYEGYVYFKNDYPQFLFVRGNKWTDFTFGYIGGNKFGFNGTPLSIFGGRGNYLVRASGNTNTWSYNKINTWGISGSALGGSLDKDFQLVQDPIEHCVWRTTVNLIEGEFTLRANNEDIIIFGNNLPATDHIPDYNGEPIRITRAGMYLIELDLSLPGNYLFHVHRKK